MTRYYIGLIDLSAKIREYLERRISDESNEIIDWQCKVGIRKEKYVGENCIREYLFTGHG